MWVWITSFGNGIKSVFTVISRIMKLENRVAALEEKIKTLQMPPKDNREGLTYNETLHLYENKITGEKFCPTCIGNNKRIAIQIRNNYGQQYWSCGNCKSSGDDGRQPQLPRYTEPEEPLY